MNVMFDTNVFNHLLEGKISRNQIPSEWHIIATHIQRDEIKKTPQKFEEKKLLLEGIFSEYVDVSVPTESAIWDLSAWNECKWGDKNNFLYKKIFSELEAIRKRSNNNADALLAETCIKNSYTLITNDGPLKKVAQNNQCQVIDLKLAYEAP